MSTRSGKRLHNSPNENIEPEHLSKKDKKTRNKRVVENDDGQIVSKSKKRQNYVSFPAAEESSVVDSVEDEVEMKPARALRRNTLKEQNPVVEEVESAINVKKQVRSTRRTKKFSETVADEAPEISQSEEPIEIVTITNGKPKSKKNKKKSKKTEKPEVTDKENETKVGKKKRNKKKKNSQSDNSPVQLDKPEEKKKNESNVSTDSFHSAAGSPVREAVTSPLNKSSPKHVEAGDKKRRSSLKRISGSVNTPTHLSMAVDQNLNSNIQKEVEIVVVRQSKRRRSSLKLMSDKDSKSLDTTEKVDLNATFETESVNEGSSKKKRKCNPITGNTDIPLKILSSNLDIPKTSNDVLNTTFEKDDTGNQNKIHKNKNSDITDQTREISSNIPQILNTSYEIRRSPRKSVNTSDNTTALNGTFDMSPKSDQMKQKSLDSTFDKETKLDSTFDKTSKKASLGSKSSLITSDDATNSSIVTLDKSDSKISITDDDSKTENILNATPLLIESSMEESKVLESSLKENTTPEPKTTSTTPLKREGTFTKDGPEASMSPKTPNKRQTLPAAGCTPYHSDHKGSQKKRSIMNRTHSIEKPTRRSALAEAAPRATRVMFCSPVNLPGVATQRKSKIIKSNLKGSNKSFVFDESMSLQVPERAERAGRKRSHTHSEVGGVASKRSRLDAAAPRAQHTPPARARTTSAMAKLSNTPIKSGTPSKPKSEVKATKLPNFAALHAKRFERMESLDECQQRKAQRARQLLVPTGSVAVLERSSPRATPTSNKLEPKLRDSPLKSATPARPAAKLPTLPTLPTLDTLQRGYTRFGFKMHCDVNPFSIPPKTAEKPKETKLAKPKETKLAKPKETKFNGLVKPNGANKPVAPKKPLASLKRQVSQPSLAGATSLRREAARLAAMRDKSCTLAERRNDARQEGRTVIKGVRTNRRFELQMKSRNING